MSYGRRDLILGFVGAALTGATGNAAQPTVRLKLIGILMPAAANDRQLQSSVVGFKQQLESLGWHEGHNLRFESRWAIPDAATLRAAAAELVQLAPDLIVTASTPALSALSEATHTIPIVFVAVYDPVGQGFVSSLAHPGANITGYAALEWTLGGKWFEVLKELIPDVSHVGYIFNPVTAPYAVHFLETLRTAARTHPVEISSAPAHDDTDIERIIRVLGSKPRPALIVAGDAFTLSHRAAILGLTAEQHLPAIYPFREFVEQGGLISCGPDIADLFQRAASYADLILKGSKAGELPVQQPTKFELVVNLKTAKVLGLTVPTPLLARADDVIE
jgi:putative ABC transport system substrate-binding protein